jgi:diguanylate cyclase (GGDEF)-like protein
VYFVTIVLLERWRERERRVRILSTTDSLTGLPNRRALFERFELELARARRQQEPVTVCVVDLDHFKQINDSHGHAAGDEVLQYASRVLRGQLRDVDLLGRIGGEEFVIVLPDTDAAAAQQALERCRIALASNDVKIEESAATLRISASFGVFCAQVDEASNVPQLLARADEALYVAKRDGRNRLAFWGEAAAIEPA